MPGAAPPPDKRAAVQAALAARREETARLARLGWSYSRIVAEAGLGHRNKTSVHADVKHVLDEAVKKMQLSGAQLLQARLEEIRLSAEVFAEVMNKPHLAHSNGKVVRRNVGTEDEPEWVEVLDDGPRIAAALAFLKASESLRKLLGQDAPTKVAGEVGATINYVINATPDELEQL